MKRVIYAKYLARRLNRSSRIYLHSFISSHHTLEWTLAQQSSVCTTVYGY